MAPWRFGSKFFRTGFTFAVALIQIEKIKVERVSVLMGHPVYRGALGISNRNAVTKERSLGKYTYTRVQNVCAG